MMNQLMASKARVKFMELVRNTADGRRYFIKHAGGAAAVLLSEKEYRSLVAVQRLFNSPERIARIQKARRDIARGKGGDYDALRRRFGLG